MGSPPPLPQEWPPQGPSAAIVGSSPNFPRSPAPPPPSLPCQCPPSTSHNRRGTGQWVLHAPHPASFIRMKLQRGGGAVRGGGGCEVAWVGLIQPPPPSYERGLPPIRSCVEHAGCRLPAMHRPPGGWTATQCEGADIPRPWRCTACACPPAPPPARPPRRSCGTPRSRTPGCGRRWSTRRRSAGLGSSRSVEGGYCGGRSVRAGVVCVCVCVCVFPGHERTAATFSVILFPSQVSDTRSGCLV